MSVIKRWHDVKVSVRLSTAVERSTVGAPRFDVLVEWEYTTTLSHPTARFTCVSDWDEFHELLSDIPATSVWLMPQRPGFDASDRAAYELVTFSIDGEPRKIRRTERQGAQTYSVDIGEEVVRAGRPVRVRYAFRTITDPANHRLFLTAAQPARDVSLAIDYSATDISRLSVIDLVPSARRPYVSQLPAGTTGRELTMELSGWIQAGTGFTFVWTLDSEETSAHPGTRPTSASPAA